MSSPFVGEIRMVGFTFAPSGWAFCSGQTLAIAQNDALFNLIGTTYGGDGVNTFALPDLRGRVPIHQGSSFVIGQPAGTETVSLTGNQVPLHAHVAAGNATAAATTPVGNFWGGTSPVSGYGTTADSNLNGGSLAAVGGSQPHENRMPFLAVNFIISLFGIFPSRN
jgi:microcystin-dependent protein